MVLRIVTQPWGVTRPEGWGDEDEDESRGLRAAEPRGHLVGTGATSWSSWAALGRLGRLLPAVAGLRAGRLEEVEATSPGCGGQQLRLLGLASEALLQGYLTLRRSEAMGTCDARCAEIRDG